VDRPVPAQIPDSPGSYQFKDAQGRVLYVGKAKSLRSRVRSYFQSGGSDTRMFIPHLLETIGDLDTIVTANEKEATILENTLIKELKPRYNVKLRDDKSYLHLRIGVSHAWPRVEPVRRAQIVFQIVIWNYVLNPKLQDVQM